MQLGVTVALATVWLAVAAGVVGTVTPRPLRLSHDQYSPASPSSHEAQQDQADWGDHDPAKDQPLDLWISSQRSISLKDSLGPPRNSERNFPSVEPVKDVTLSKQNSLASSWKEWLLNIGGSEFAADKVDYGGMPETLPREMPLSELDDPFVADDTFQDQGPGSVEIYKLDLSKEKALLTATTPFESSPTKNKSKAPKKVDHVSLKTKTTEIKSTTSPKTLHRQSNFFEEQRTETPVNRDAFGVGGVPELQVGCEGLAAWSHKTKRSIDTPGKEEASAPPKWLLDVTSTIDLDHGSYEDEDEDNYEERDELLRIRKMEELAAKRSKSNRGDIDPILNAYHLNNREPDELPVRGDIGATAPRSKLHHEDSQKLSAGIGIGGREEANAARETVSSDDNNGGRGRRLLWLAEANTEGFADDERKRAKRRIDWGFGEDEGVVSSDELQTVNQRRRQHEMRYHQNARIRDQQQRQPDSEVDNIRQEYERVLEQKRREEEERLRRMQQGGRETSSRWQEEEERRRGKMRRRHYEEYRRRIDHVSAPRTNAEEAQQLEERRRHEATRNRTQEMARRSKEEYHRRKKEEQRRRLQEENARTSESATPASDQETRRRLEERQRQEEEERKRSQDEARRREEQYRWQQEAQRRREEEARRQASRRDPTRNHPEEDGRRLEEERRRQWPERQRQEDERRRQQDRSRSEVPAGLVRSGHHRVNHPNELGQRDWDPEKRVQEEERRREQKLREYIARNRPIVVNRPNTSRNDDEYRGRVEEQRRQQEEERRQREEERRRQEEERRQREEERRRQEDERRRQEAERERQEDERKRQEDERRRQDHTRREQTFNVPTKSNQSIGRELFDQRRLIEDARQRSGYPDSGAARRHGPWVPTDIDPRGSLVARRRQEERRLEEERRLARERQLRYEAEERRKELARRQQEEEPRRQQEERWKEAVRREEEIRREQSRRYEEERKRLEAARVQTGRWRQETLRQRGWGGGRTVGGTRQPEATRSPDQNPRLEQHRRIQESQPIPGYLVRDDSRRLAEERQRQQQERARLEAERRRQEEESRRQKDLVRLHALPVKARVIIRPSDTSLPPVISRTNFENEIEFAGISPNREGVPTSNFPAPSTSRPPVPSPGPCVWAVVQCCSRNNNRLNKCFESMGCPGISWDPDPCRHSIIGAARAEVMKFYTNARNP